MKLILHVSQIALIFFVVKKKFARFEARLSTTVKGSKKLTVTTVQSVTAVMAAKFETSR